MSFLLACFLQASTQQGLAIIHQEPVLTHPGQESSQQELALTHRVQVSIPRGLATSRLAQAQNTLPAPATHQLLARRQAQDTFPLAQGRNTRLAPVTHRFLVRRQVQATFRLAQGRSTLLAPAASHLELHLIPPDQAISLLAAGLQGVAAVTERACIQQGRGRQPRLVQGGPSTQARVQ